MTTGNIKAGKSTKIAATTGMTMESTKVGTNTAIARTTGVGTMTMTASGPGAPIPTAATNTSEKYSSRAAPITGRAAWSSTPIQIGSSPTTTYIAAAIGNGSAIACTSTPPIVTRAGT